MVPNHLVKTLLIGLVLSLAAIGTSNALASKSVLLATKVIRPKSTSVEMQVGSKPDFVNPQPYRSYTVKAVVPKGQKVKLSGMLTCDGYLAKNFSPKFVGSFTHTVRIPGGYLSADYCTLTFYVSRYAYFLETGTAKGKIVVRVFGDLR